MEAFLPAEGGVSSSHKRPPGPAAGGAHAGADQSDLGVQRTRVSGEVDRLLWPGDGWTEWGLSEAGEEQHHRPTVRNTLHQPSEGRGDSLQWLLLLTLPATKGGWALYQSSEKVHANCMMLVCQCFSLSVYPSMLLRFNIGMIVWFHTVEGMFSNRLSL